MRIFQFIVLAMFVSLSMACNSGSSSSSSSTTSFTATVSVDSNLTASKTSLSCSRSCSGSTCSASCESVEVTPDAGYEVEVPFGGTCAYGSRSGNYFWVGSAATGDCTVEFSSTPTKKIFVTAATVAADLGVSEAAAITAADAACMADANKPSDGATYKAILVNSARRACQSADCATNGASENLNWVLAASTKYYRTDGTTLIGTTNSSGVFTFPITAQVHGSSTTYATGLGANWVTSTDNCSGWTSDSNTVDYTYGYGASTSDHAISSSTNACDQASFLLCVSQ